MFLLKVVKALNKKGVDYALAGGYAVALHGAVRATVDIDLVINISMDSFQKSESALNSIGLKSRLPVSGKDVFNFRKEYIENKNMIAWNFINPANPSELVDIIITEDLSNISTKNIEVFEVNISLISLKDLIRMKERTDRPQDIEDVKTLRKLVK